MIFSSFQHYGKTLKHKKDGKGEIKKKVVMNSGKGKGKGKEKEKEIRKHRDKEK